MRAIHTFFILLLLSSIVISQNKVGINKIPAETFDVAGNINADGNYLINGQSGNSGQVLGTNSSGNSQWVNLHKFDHVISFIWPLDASATWTIPAGVTLIYVELIGGGGGASHNGGGGGGLFRSFYAAVSPGNILNYTVGSGGAHASTSNGPGSSGKTTTVIINSTTFSAPYGTGAGGGTSGVPGAGGYDAVNGSSSFSAFGQSGTTNKIYYSYGPGGASVLTTEYGSGGGTYPHYVRNEGGFRSEIPSLSSILRNVGATYLSTYGSGGASDSSLGAQNNGEKGIVRIYY